MAAGETMSEDRVESLKVVLPRMESRLSLKSFETQLQIGPPGGFLTDYEVNEVFCKPNPADQVRALVKFLSGKNNAAFDGFCNILEKNHYGNWSKELKIELRKGMIQNLGPDKLRELFYIKGVDETEGRRLGGGTFGEIFEATWNGTPCALKTFHETVENKKELYTHVEREAYLWALYLRHPNIVQFYGLWEREGSDELPSIVMERLTINLHKFLQNNIKLRDSIPLDLKRAILLDVCSAMIYLHDHNIIHRDLKASNILLTSSLVAKVSDFGTARICETTGPMTKVAITAPEVATGKYGPEVDVFSYGSVTMQIVTHEEPVPDQSMAEKNEYQKRKGWIAGLDLSKYEELPNLMEHCLSDAPGDRPTFIEIHEELSKKPHTTDDIRYSIQVGDLQNHTLKHEEPSAIFDKKLKDDASPRPVISVGTMTDTVAESNKLSAVIEEFLRNQINETLLKWLGAFVFLSFALCLLYLV